MFTSSFNLNLSEASIIEIIDAFVDFKRKFNPNYKSLNLRSVVLRAEKTFKCTLKPEQVTDIFYANLIQWLHESGLKYSTIRSYCDQLRCLLFWAAKHGCKLSSTFDSYRIPSYFARKLALTQDEISHIAHYDVYKLPGRPQTIKTLERVRDTFVLCCNLGQRYSDIIRLCPENFNRNIYRTMQKKTGSKAVVDIDKYAIIPTHTYRLLEKYGYRSPYTSTASNFNHYLHKLLKIIGDEFDQTVSLEVKENGVMVREYHKKWELCTSHTGRRSFISINVMRCPTEAEVRKCSGHSSARSFERYISFGED